LTLKNKKASSVKSRRLRTRDFKSKTEAKIVKINA
jgi:hypothetical protein